MSILFIKLDISIEKLIVKYKPQHIRVGRKEIKRGIYNGIRSNKK